MKPDRRGTNRNGQNSNSVDPIRVSCKILLGEVVVAKHLMPEDARIIHCVSNTCISTCRRSLDVLIESEAFDDVEPGNPMRLMEWSTTLEVNDKC